MDTYGKVLIWTGVSLGVGLAGWALYGFLRGPQPPSPSPTPGGCPSGTHWNGGFCEKDCPAGEYWNGYLCVPAPVNGQPPICPAGTYWDGYECVSNQIPCPAGTYWTGQGCAVNTAKQNMVAWDCTNNSSVLPSGCFMACWSGVPIGTTELQIWHVNPAKGEGIEQMVASIPPQDSSQTVCGLLMVHGGTQHWNVRALQNGQLIGYSNVVGSVTTT